HLRALKAEGVTDVVVAPVGFTSDHMEVLYDLDTEAKQLSEELGVNMLRAATVGTHPEFVRMIRELMLERLDPGVPRRVLGAFPASHDVCPVDCCLSGMARPGARPPAD
ncbi:MAG TPA: ferrochelatase, partial [Pyrinomonadaceae bacterium]